MIAFLQMLLIKTALRFQNFPKKGSVFTKELKITTSIEVEIVRILFLMQTENPVPIVRKGLLHEEFGSLGVKTDYAVQGSFSI